MPRLCSEFLRASQASLKVQKLLRGKAVRLRLAVMRSAASRIKAWFRMRWARDMFLQTRKAAAKIQARPLC